MKTILTSAFVLAASALASFGNPTVIDTAFNPANGHTYDLLSSSDWLPAESMAMSLGGHLVTINDQAENDWVLNKWGHTRSVMIGATDAASEGHFVWTSGDPFIYTNWDPGEPNNGVGYGQVPENYTFMYADGFGTAAGKWNDTQGINANRQPQPDFYGVVEIVPEPAIASVLLMGLLGMPFLRKLKRDN